jgi:hypothetical protein
MPGIDFSTALRQEAESTFRTQLLSALDALGKKVESLEAKVDALTKSRTPKQTAQAE